MKKADKAVTINLFSGNKVSLESESLGIKTVLVIVAIAIILLSLTVLAVVLGKDEFAEIIRLAFSNLSKS